MEMFALTLAAREPGQPSPVDVWLKPLCDDDDDDDEEDEEGGKGATEEEDRGAEGREQKRGGGEGQGTEEGKHGGRSGGRKGGEEVGTEIGAAAVQPPPLEHWVWAVQNALKLDAEQVGFALTGLGFWALGLGSGS